MIPPAAVTSRARAAARRSREPGGEHPRRRQAARDDGGLLRGIGREIAADAPLHGLIAGYAAIVFVLARLAGRPDKFQPVVYAEKWLAVLPLIAVAGGALLLAVAAIVARPRAPLAGVAVALRSAALPRLVAGLVLFTATTLFYGAFTSAKNLLPDLVGFGWDAALADLDAWLHGGRAPWALVHAVTRDFTRGIDFLYSTVWGLVLLCVVVAVAMLEGDAARRRHFFVVLLGCWVLLGHVVAGAFFSGGPIFYDRVTGDPTRFSALMAHLSDHRDPYLGVRVYQAYLWRIHVGGDVGLGAGISAFPSMHLSMATLVALVLARRHRLLVAPAILFVAFILVGSVHLGWHYAVDGYASILGTLGLWWAAGAWLGWRRPAWAGVSRALRPAIPRLAALEATR